MREIVFRGKRVEDGKWLYGYYSDEKAEDTDFPCIVPLEPVPDYDWEVDPETVGQYTGLKDKNGKKIFEGDIVKYTEIDIDGSDDKYIGVIYYNQSTANYVIQKGKYMVNFVTSWICDVEVIGNVYDDVNLLEV